MSHFCGPDRVVQRKRCGQLPWPKYTTRDGKRRFDYYKGCMRDVVATEAAQARRGTSMAAAAAILMAGVGLLRPVGPARGSLPAHAPGAPGPDPRALTPARALPPLVLPLLLGCPRRS